MRTNLRWLRGARPAPRAFSELAPRVLAAADAPCTLGELHAQKEAGDTIAKAKVSQKKSRVVAAK